MCQDRRGKAIQEQRLGELLVLPAALQRRQWPAGETIFMVLSSVILPTWVAIVLPP
jgi:hypothetical protein